MCLLFTSEHSVLQDSEEELLLMKDFIAGGY
jgi:hypothetical protein